MLLRKLEIAGFKSFAKPVILEFPVAISGIVGPNGSGKSNVADSIRWVLGEQSMKSLRGKRGEDLIFGGTSQAARMGKAQVSLVFDNTKKVFPYEFNEVIITRRVYRDGTNEYLLNNSLARLKDIIEILSKVGLGASQHHIIGQGDADRILYASPRERKATIEEALGLKIFELKKTEAERKLVQTEENISRAESLRRELKPHLKYLEEQAKKSQNVSRLREDLLALTHDYVTREGHTIAEARAHGDKAERPLQEQIKSLESTVAESEHLMKRDMNAQTFFVELKKLDDAHRLLQEKRRDLERQMGRIEATAQSGKNVVSEGYSTSKVRAILEDIVADLEFANQTHTMAEIREVIDSLLASIQDTMRELGKPSSSQSIGSSSAELSLVKTAIADLEQQERKLLASREHLETEYRAQSQAAEKANTDYRIKNEELVRARDALRTVLFEKQTLDTRAKEFALDFGEITKQSFTEGVVWEMMSERDQTRKKIERLRIRIEEAGGVDEGVLDEFEETQKRDEFLAHELEDLERAKKQVKEMFEELESRIAKDFDKGLDRINVLFGKFFQEIFGGGKAEIKLVVPKKKLPAHDEETAEDDESSFAEASEDEEEPGLEIMVDIPRKRIKSLAMLSGGERALTSIALLFAMSTVNPPPFLVLDETDAALDEANSSRYGVMLQALSQKTQLIVITHNRATMKVASVLYGVTMGSDGVSKLLSIQFEDAEEVLAKKK